MSLKPLPEGDQIYDLFTGGDKPQIVRIALALDVFSPLDSGPATAGAVSRACRSDETGIQRLLDYLVSLSVLHRQGEEYILSPEAAVFLVRGKKSYAGELIMDLTGPALWQSLQQTVRSGQPRALYQEIHFAQDAWIESYRAVRLPSSLEMWAKAGIHPGPATRLRLLDIACGCAIKSLALVRESPGMALTCLDQPLVLEAARDLAERWGLTAQVRLRPGNLLTADLGREEYDACLVGQISHYLSEAQNRELFARIAAALAPGGKLVLDVPMGTGQPEEISSFLSLLLWANSGGSAYRFEEYRGWLMEAGFDVVRPLSERLLVATRPGLDG